MHIIAGTYRQRQLAAPAGLKTRPTSNQLRESLFNICQSHIEGALFLDIFAGSGAVGLEALSRGAKSVTFIDNSKEAIRCIKQNITTLGVQNQCLVFYGDILQFQKQMKNDHKLYDIIFADPPYHTPVSFDSAQILSEQVIRWVDSQMLLTKDGYLFVEEAFKFQPNLSDLTHLKLDKSRKMGLAALQQYRLSQ